MDSVPLISGDDLSNLSDESTGATSTLQAINAISGNERGLIVFEDETIIGKKPRESDFFLAL